MVTNNKVLTVSYGTFSCTLEGFDDSFDTMKAIAEYFRDLAADDRYFGAEPPTPDAEMLARIAEREVERRVQARTEHGAIVLTTTAPEAEAEVDTPAIEEKPEEQPQVSQEDTVVDEASEAEAEPEVVDVTESVLEAVTAPEPEVAEAEELVEDAAEDVIAEAVEEPVVDDAAEEAIAEADVEEDGLVAAEEELAEDTVDAEDVADTEIVAIDDDAEPLDVVEDAEVVEETTEADDTLIAGILDASGEDTAQEDDLTEAAEEEFTAEADEPAPVETETDSDSIAAKLQRIRAVVSKSRDVPSEGDYIEDEHAELMMPELNEPEEDVLTLDGDMAAAAAAIDATDDLEEDVAEDLVEEVVADVEADVDPEPVQPVRARVIRMKKADFEAALDDGLLEAEPVEDDEDDFDDESGAMADVAAPSSLSDAEEAELLAELAEVEAELNGEVDDEDDDEPVIAIGADPDEPVRPSRSQHLSEVSQQSDADMSRLMQEADTHMEEPQGSRRRQAIAHLRAAVAATKAEQKAGSDLGKNRDATEAYRHDLANVISPLEAAATPRRPQVAEAPETPRESPAPLKLVAEQRVDTPEEPQAAETAEPANETPRAPVRPRRVSAAERAEAADASPVSDSAGDFAEFADSVGAHSLPQVLEAAAAYLTFVEGLDVFSRPMIVRMAQGMSDGEYSREDSLRGFGQLLRDNKIAKVSGGRFTASDEIGFRPEDRAAG
ncbi:hypothetical protein [uncultured Shimia sp.]|uniref:hypothetical protein n=1 Tax=uncultured Shimia sp. TaxID=573152 RepID=UPI00260293E8|nr:hypothetical protein [uncultured Shimia sp.]